MPRKKKKKSEKVTLIKCPYEDCEMYFFSLDELYDHIEWGAHCPKCGYAIGQSPKNDLTGRFCPACKLEDIAFPSDWRKIC